MKQKLISLKETIDAKCAKYRAQSIDSLYTARYNDLATVEHAVNLANNFLLVSKQADVINRMIQYYEGTSFSDEEFFSRMYVHFTKKHPELTAFMDGIKSFLFT